MQIMTVPQFVAYVNDTFKAIWDPTDVAIEGEVSGFRVSQGQWASFDLKDADALVNVFLPLWKLSVPLADGLRARVFGFPRVYPKYGKFSFNAERVELVGEGTLRKALAALRQKFVAEGLFDPSRKRTLPRFPQRIALIASRESAAYGDFVRILNERWGGLEIDLYHVTVQGERAAGEIVKAIEYVNAVGAPLAGALRFVPADGSAGAGRAGVRPAPTDYDALILTRGGGSVEELMAFNDERVVRALYASKIPTLVGIGHERDITFAEEVADVRGSTPTDCARRLVPDKTDVTYELSVLQEQIADALDEFIHDRLETIGNALASADRWIAGLSERRASYDRFFRSVDPRAVLNRGYAIVRDASGRPAMSVRGIRPSDGLAVELRDGSMETRVQSVYAKKENRD